MSTIGVAKAASNHELLPKKDRGLSPSILSCFDLAAVEASLAIACSLHLGLFHLGGVSPNASYCSMALAVAILPLIFAALGLYPGYTLGPVQRLQRRVFAIILFFSMLLVWDIAFEHGVWSRAVLVLTMLSSLGLSPFVENVGRSLLMNAGTWGAAVAVVGANDTGRRIIEKLKKNRSLGLRPVALIDDNPNTWGTQIDDVPVVGPLSIAADIRAQVQIAVVPSAGMETHRVLSLIENLAFPTVLMVPDLHGLQSLWTVSRDLGGTLGLELRKNMLVPGNRAIKRAMDCLLAIPLLLASTPIILLSILSIKMVSPGPAFFRQKREGENGRSINIWKLRTMYPNADALLEAHLQNNPEAQLLWKRHYKLKRDPRVLPVVGTILRRFSLDELPQLWNVLLGDMSLVGPRPFPEYHLEGFSDTFRSLRRSVTPGLTGLWQVSERSDGDLTAQEAQDTYYIRNWSLWFDIYLLTKTVERVLMPKGAY